MLLRIRPIKEIIGPVIQRSVTIATRTTEEFILKVNAMDYFPSCTCSLAIFLAVVEKFLTCCHIFPVGFGNII